MEELGAVRVVFSVWGGGAVALLPPEDPAQPGQPQVLGWVTPPVTVISAGL